MGKKVAPVQRIPELRPGRYADGHPLDDVQYVESKIILRPERFTSRDSFWDFARIVKRVAREHGAGFETAGFARQRPQIREVVFLDTADFRLYRSGFILRRRIAYQDGFPAGEPEVVFKYRIPDLQEAAAVDVRPRIEGDYRIKFKAEVLPPREGAGGVRMLYSHNCEFPLGASHGADHRSLEAIARALPALSRLERKKGDSIALVNHTIVEEVLQDVGMLDFGKGLRARASVALWRERGDHAPLVGEFSYQLKFKRRNELHAKAIRRCEQFFVSLQLAIPDWILPGATKTGIVYRSRGNPPQSHE
ncbi:MAG TPA: hypothetical protein VFM53_16270 [Anaeromyxobacteraceae bacterium]|nr:hypothetical protein [Anaeromyxobacteraceae bacterium]